MPLINPFVATYPEKTYAKDLIAPPYDVINRLEAKQFVQDKPLNFLNISRAEVHFADTTDQYSAEVYAKAASLYHEFLNKNILQKDETPCFYLYQLQTDTHQQLGLVCTTDIKAYEQNKIHKHEHTKPVKQQDRTEHIKALNAQTGPVLLSHRDDKDLAACLTTLSEQYPVYFDVTAKDGVRHKIWRIDKSEDIASINELANKLTDLYIADGHHRSAAGAQVAKEYLEQQHELSASAQQLLSVLFPAASLNILGYHRVIKDLNGLSQEAFLTALKKSFDITPEKQATLPKSAKCFSLYLDKQWYQLTFNAASTSAIKDNDLDVALLSDHILAPILGITDQRQDPRIDFVGGERGLDGLQARVDSGDMQLAIALYPTPMSAIFKVADANAIMPPKSTWFEPKLADGLLSYSFF